jgi:hypothetical protein
MQKILLRNENTSIRSRIWPFSTELIIESKNERKNRKIKLTNLRLGGERNENLKRVLRRVRVDLLLNYLSGPVEQRAQEFGHTRQKVVGYLVGRQVRVDRVAHSVARDLQRYCKSTI